MLKESKIRVLENFYALDYVFFGKPVNQVDMCCPLVKEEYLSVKGALMSVFIEMLKLVEHKPEVIEEKMDSKLLRKNAVKSAKIARENSQKIVSSQKARVTIKDMLKEALQEDPKIDVSNLVEKTIRSKAFGLAVDNLLIARSLKESKAFKKLDEWEGRIVEDSYKILRDNLVESAYMILYDEDKELEEGWKTGAALGGLIGLLSPLHLPATIGLAAAGGAIQHWIGKNKQKVQAYCKQKFPNDKHQYDYCISQGNVELKKKVKAAKDKVNKKRSN